MTGGPKHGPGPYASLMLDLELGPGATRTLTFAEAALDTIPAAFDLARKTAARSWQAELARIEMLDASQVVDIRTGDPEWDAALAFSQKAAHLCSNGNGHQPSFVTARHIDHGFAQETAPITAANGQFRWMRIYQHFARPKWQKPAAHLHPHRMNGKVDDAHRRPARKIPCRPLHQPTWKYYQATGRSFSGGKYFQNNQILLVVVLGFDRNRDAPEWDANRL